MKLKHELKKHGSSASLFVDGVRITKSEKLSGDYFTFRPVPRCGLPHKEITVHLDNLKNEILSKINPRWIEAQKTGHKVSLNFTKKHLGSLGDVQIDGTYVGTTKKIAKSVYHFFPSKGVNLPANKKGMNADQLEIEIAIAAGSRKF